MKTHLIIFLIFLSGILLAQEKKIEFSKELSYKSFSANKTNKLLPSFKILSSNKGEFLTLVEMNYLPIQLFSNEVGMIPVKIGFDNVLSNSPFINYFLFGNFYTKSDRKAAEITVENLKTKETILGISCNNYLLSYPLGTKEDFGAEEIPTEKIKVCIDEKNAINNVPVVSSIINELNNAKLAPSLLKGMVLKLGPAEAENKEFIVLKSIKDTKNFAFFDQRKAMMQQQRTADSLFVEKRKYEDELNFGEADSTQVILQDSAFIDEDLYLEKYSSTYKKKPEEGSYAIDELKSKKMWEILPTHCKNLDKDLPKLDNATFGMHLRNLTAQLCDLYLTQNEYHNVAVKITIDEIRRELLYITQEKEKLNKSDRKKVNQYLEKLD